MQNSFKFAVILLACASTLTGCAEYPSRHEGVTSFAGESLAANEAVSVVDIWPEGFENTDIPTDGKRQARAIEKYRNPVEVIPVTNTSQTQDVTR